MNGMIRYVGIFSDRTGGFFRDFWDDTRPGKRLHSELERSTIL